MGITRWFTLGNEFLCHFSIRKLQAFSGTDLLNAMDGFHRRQPRLESFRI